jgi:hypothetical protein
LYVGSSIGSLERFALEFDPSRLAELEEARALTI